MVYSAFGTESADRLDIQAASQPVAKQPDKSHGRQARQPELGHPGPIVIVNGHNAIWPNEI